MALVGALAVVAIAYAARELAGPRVGVVAAVLAAVYPGLWVNDLVATSESPAVLLLARDLVPVAAVPARADDPATRRCSGCPSACSRSTARELVPARARCSSCPAVVAVARDARPRPGAPCSAASSSSGVLAVAVVVPWSVVQPAALPPDRAHLERPRPDARRGELPESYYGPLHGLRRRYCFLPVLSRDSEGACQRGRGRRLLPAHGRCLRRCTTGSAGPSSAALRELWLWSLWRPGWTVFMSGVYIGRPQWIAWSQIVAFWLLTPFAFVGFVVARRRRIPRRAARHAGGLHRGDRAARRRAPPLPDPRRARLGAARARSRSTGSCSGRREATSARRGVSRRWRAAGAAWGDVWRTGKTPRRRTAASSATNVMTADQRKATLNPEVTAASVAGVWNAVEHRRGQRADRGETAWLVATVASSASPSEPPTWREVLRMPDARPASFARDRRRRRGGERAEQEPEREGDDACPAA